MFQYRKFIRSRTIISELYLYSYNSGTNSYTDNIRIIILKNEKDMEMIWPLFTRSPLRLHRFPVLMFCSGRDEIMLPILEVYMNWNEVIPYLKIQN